MTCRLETMIAPQLRSRVSKSARNCGSAVEHQSETMKTLNPSTSRQKAARVMAPSSASPANRTVWRCVRVTSDASRAAEDLKSPIVSSNSTSGEEVMTDSSRSSGQGDGPSPFPAEIRRRQTSSDRMRSELAKRLYRRSAGMPPTHIVQIAMQTVPASTTAQDKADDKVKGTD